jgi:hypothetical protein
MLNAMMAFHRNGPSPKDLLAGWILMTGSNFALIDLCYGEIVCGRLPSSRQS